MHLLNYRHRSWYRWPSLLVLIVIMKDIVPAHTSKVNYAEAGLLSHNNYRAKHGAPALVLDSVLSDKADECAEYYLDKSKKRHSCPNKDGTGENIYWSSDSNLSGTFAVSEAVRLWYEEIQGYDWKLSSHKDEKSVVGHFTQLVWKSSKKLGIGFAAREGDGVIVVALYDPPGNYRGQNKEYVLPLLNAKNKENTESDYGYQRHGGYLVLCLGLLMMFSMFAGGFLFKRRVDNLES